MRSFFEESESIGRELKQQCMERLLKDFDQPLRRVLLLPPDYTRYHSGAGELTEIVYNLLPPSCQIDIIPTLGQHVPMSEEEIKTMFGSIPLDRFHVHDWRQGCKRLGEVSSDFVRQVSNGKVDFSVPIELNRRMVDEPYDLIISIGHVVPHEVLGFANYNKNFYIGLGGKETINASHFMAASYGIENNLGRLRTPLRLAYNRADEDYLKKYPIVYVLLVMSYNDESQLVTRGLYVGEDEDTYIRAARLSRKLNVTVLEKPLPKVVTFMDGSEFKSTWVANKAIYRTRMAIADDGELLIIAPGLERFGEDKEIDKLIRKYGYRGTPRITEAMKTNGDLQDLRVGAAHLMHGSSEGRFNITYAPGKLTREEIEGVNFRYADLNETLQRYDPQQLKAGWNTLKDGEKIYFIPSPATGLWALKGQL